MISIVGFAKRFERSKVRKYTTTLNSLDHQDLSIAHCEYTFFGATAKKQTGEDLS